MADTNFTDNNTALANRIVAAWLNDVNVFVYRGTWAPGHNAVDIGTSIKAPKTGYFATSIVTPLLSGVTGVLSFSDSITPSSDAGKNVGSPTLRVASVFATAIDSGTSGSLSLKTNNGTEQLRVMHLASAVNVMTVAGSATGSYPTWGIQGSDTNSGFQIGTAGTGSFNFYTGGSNSSLGTGFVTQFQILHTASSSRNITITGSNGGNPVIDVTAGALKLSSGTADIQWGKANVALGGGAAPTVGTIGGSGPAAAAQRNWLRFIESDGTASFIPVWR